MRSPAQSPAPVSVFQRVLALLCIGLIGFLGVAGASAELHARMHASADHADGGDTHPAAHDEGCVIDLFAQGVSSAIEQPRVVAVGETGESLYQTVAEQATPGRPAALLPPPCGPPLK